MKGLCLDSKTQERSLDYMRELITPAPSGRHHRIPPISLIDGVKNELATGGWGVKSERHATADDNSRYFGVMYLEHPEFKNPEYGTTVGLRNSWDKSFRAAVSIGNDVFVCANEMFIAEMQIGRRNTINAERDIPKMLSTLVGNMSASYINQQERVASYKDCSLSRKQVHDIVCTALRQKTLPSSKIVAVLNEFEGTANLPDGKRGTTSRPIYRHDEFSDPTLWSLLNAVTEVGKAWPMSTLATRTMRLQGQFDRLVKHTPVEMKEADAEAVEV